MRLLLQYLRKTYPNANKEKINHWVNCQYARKGTAMGLSVALRDVGECEVVKSVKGVVESLSLDFEHLLSSLKVVARINSTSSAFEPVIKFGFNIYQDIFTKAGMVIKDFLFGFDVDEVIYTGSNKHVQYKQGDKKQSGEASKIMSLFINYELPTIGVVGSLIIDAEEIAATKDSGIINGMNGVDPFSAEEWLSISASLLFKRLISDANFPAISKVFEQSTITYIKEIIAVSEECYGKSQNKEYGGDDRVFSSYGKVIARKFKRFNIMDKKKHQGELLDDVVVPISASRRNKAVLDAVVSEAATKDNVVKPKSLKERSNLNVFSNF